MCSLKCYIYNPKTLKDYNLLQLVSPCLYYVYSALSVSKTLYTCRVSQSLKIVLILQMFF